MKITSTEFQQNVGRYQDEALKRPVTITKNGRERMVLISMDLFNALLQGRAARRIEDLDDATVEAITNAEVPARFNHLDKPTKG